MGVVALGVLTVAREPAVSQVAVVVCWALRCSRCSSLWGVVLAV
jgi:hypothetical protein